MDIVGIFGDMLEKKAPGDPEGARKLLLAGYRAQHAALNMLPREYPPSRRYAGREVIRIVINALSRPESAAMVSLFTPCEPLLAAGITPYSAETVSGYISGTDCGKLFLDHASGEGLPDTLCSFHRICLGAADMGFLPKPRFMAYTNLACDANMASFPCLVQKFGIPHFFVDVPYEKSDDAVKYVAEQLRGMAAFISDVSGKPVSDGALRQAVGRSARTARNYCEYLSYLKKSRLPGDGTGEMWNAFMSHILLGSEEAEKYSGMLLRDVRKAPESAALRLLWIHVIPFLQPCFKELLSFNDRAFVTACDLAYESMGPIDASRPYEAMARRMVYSCYNGSPDGRIALALETARLTGADGAVVFAHRGCKSTLGSARIIKNALEAEGLPALILDGDGCDFMSNSDGAMATRIGAFLEMLEEKRK